MHRPWYGSSLVKIGLVSVILLLVAGADPAVPVKAPPKELPLILRVPRPAGTEWFGLYVLGKKAGYASNEIHTDTFEGQPVVVLVSVVDLTAKVGGVPTQRLVHEERYYEAKDGGRMIAFRIERHGDGGEDTEMGRCSPKGIHLTRVRPGFPKEERDLPPTAEVVEESDAPRVVAFTRKPLEGKVMDEDDIADKGSTSRLLGESTFIVAGVTVPVVRVETIEEKDNVPTVETIDREGRTLEIKFGDVMTAEAEPEALAKKLDEVDLFALTRVILPKAIGPEARKVPESITFRVKGLNERFTIPSTRQTLKHEADGSVLLTVKADLPHTHAIRPEPAKDGDIADALKATLAIESDNPQVKEMAEKVVGDVPDAYAASKRLVLFVNKYLQKAYGASSDRCTDVIAAKKGDCTEHALLFTCLARAAGIPARRVDGLVYMDNGDSVPALYWHEWAEVWVGEWVAVDPTFNEPIADATHIALGGEGTAQSAGLIGQLKIEVASSKGSPAPAGEIPQRGKHAPPSQ
jgi:transglutaminase-like putative cysteine protease